MKRSAGVSEGFSPERRRRLAQILFVFVNVALVEVHLPGPLWFAIGAIFWLALIGVTIAGSGVVCGTMCWIGAIQDIFEPFARPRLRIDARAGRAFTLLLLVLWMPIGWLLLPHLAVHDRTPLNFSLAWERHLFQFALAAVAAASVVFLGKRGLCRYLCPFNSIVASIRRLLPGRTLPAIATSTENTASPCAAGCAGCTRSDRDVPTTAYERLTIA